MGEAPIQHPYRVPHMCGVIYSLFVLITIHFAIRFGNRGFGGLGTAEIVGSAMRTPRTKRNK